MFIKYQMNYWYSLECSPVGGRPSSPVEHVTCGVKPSKTFLFDTFEEAQAKYVEMGCDKPVRVKRVYGSPVKTFGIDYFGEVVKVFVDEDGEVVDEVYLECVETDIIPYVEDY